MLKNTLLVVVAVARQMIGEKQHPERMMDAGVCEWLQSLELDEYTESFHSAGYTTVDDLMDLDAAQLQHIGVTSVTHQLRLLYAVDRIRQTVDSSTVI